MPFRKGDGFDVYIDGARTMPDNTTVTKVVVILLLRWCALTGCPE